MTLALPGLWFQVKNGIILFEVDCINNGGEIGKALADELQQLLPFFGMVFAENHVHHYFAGSTEPNLEVAQKPPVFAVVVETVTLTKGKITYGIANGVI